MGNSIISLANQKGGVGKTTLTVHLAAWLARQGRRVIVIDADPQGNATSWLLDGDTSDPALFRLLVVGDSLGRCARSVNGRWGIGLLPGNARTAEATIFLSATQKPFDLIARLLRPLAGVCDYVLIDMPPSEGPGFREFLFAADWILVPTQLERLSLEGVILMARTCQEIAAERGRGPRLLGIVPNLARLHTLEHRAGLADLVARFGATIWPCVPLSVAIAAAASHGRTIFDYAPADPAAHALALIAERLIENIGAAQ